MTASSSTSAPKAKAMPRMTRKLAALEKAGHPVVRIVMKSIDHIGQEFFRFEMAIAVAGSVLGINPFNQPDVEAAKIKTRELTAAFEKTGSLPDGTAGGLDRRGRYLYRRQQRRGLAQGGRQWRSRLLAEGPSRALRRRRLRRAARLYRAQRRAYRHAAAHAAGGARQAPCRDLRRIRPALPAFHRTGLQGRPRQRRVPADHRR